MVDESELSGRHLTVHLDDDVLRVRLFEYERAEAMLRHYDTLNWQIGSILVAATAVVFGFSLDGVAASSPIVVVFLVPLFSFLLLGFWFHWYKRHASLYNFRNEVMHRVEFQFGMYNALRVLESADPEAKESPNPEAFRERLRKAKLAAGHSGDDFIPFRTLELEGPSSYTTAWWLWISLPSAQLAILLTTYLLR